MKLYFVGIGGIGMSALVRYFLSKGDDVAGYDLTPSPLTKALTEEGALIHYEDDPELIPEPFRSPDTLVVFTPAVPRDHRELNFFIHQGNRVIKRAELLGDLTRRERGLCVAGTHGKTTTSTLLAHLLRSSHVDCHAFLGGISNNYQTNCLISEKSDYAVIEADEFDRSFHHLSPYIAVITSADPDHLDIYHTAEAYRESFEHFTSLISSEGALVMKKGIPVTPRLKEGTRLFTYTTGDEEADFWGDHIEIREGHLFFDWHYPALDGQPAGSLHVELGVPLLINVENAVAAMAVAYLCGARLDELSQGVASFRGVYRRFDRIIDDPRCVLIDDYAHHPNELDPSIRSVRQLYPDRKILGIFQPHLYSRTQDFYREFAHSLDQLDEVILLDIYPARELPIPGVTSHLIAEAMEHKDVVVLPKEGLLPHLRSLASLPEVILMVGAGDIDRLVPQVAEEIRQRL
ncbi:UDP-N-acetylmuramate--L-alanine ligase [Porphyromonas sp. oral taxon 278 str. W7784]|uniref:UDP-N-acetylmuramate--L-alanine ligase n=1 Tax=Porphyromonas sp. oral taxon 278 TaxID=712437 RepID=UPI0003AD3B4F|nr:UDP-N-acetylmuramate--L-alanine ligase [Porphyromonas sp. oral taxon 278]ERJ73233.1 UDP-N-acetylmuramate--L-alanine ligase [Porphyromonas sp. oral taxon 278 str. W7784]